MWCTPCALRWEWCWCQSWTTGASIQLICLPTDFRRFSHSWILHLLPILKTMMTRKSLLWSQNNYNSWKIFASFWWRKGLVIQQRGMVCSAEAWGQRRLRSPHQNWCSMQKSINNNLRRSFKVEKKIHCHVRWPECICASTGFLEILDRQLPFGLFNEQLGWTWMDGLPARISYKLWSDIVFLSLAC